MKSALAQVSEAPDLGHREPVLAFVADAESRSLLGDVLAEMNLPPGLVHEGGIGTALSRLTPETSPGRLIVDVSESASGVDDMVALTASLDPSTKVIALGAVNDVALFRDLLAAGATDYLVKPLDRRVVHNALSAPVEREDKATASGPLGRVVVFVGARGGLGATTAAASVAWLLAYEFQHRVGLVDLDLHFGTVGLALDLEASGGLREALERPARIDSLFIDRATVKRGDRLFVMSAEESLDENPAIDPAGLEVLLRELRARFEAVVIDLPRQNAALHAAALAAATDVYVISDLSLAGIRDIIRLEGLVKRKAPKAKVRVIACPPHPAARGGNVSQADFERGIGRKIDCLLPHDPKAAALGLNTGKPLPEVAPRSPLVKTLRQVAGQVFAVEKPAAPAPFWRLWKK